MTRLRRLASPTLRSSERSRRGCGSGGVRARSRPPRTTVFRSGWQFRRTRRPRRHRLESAGTGPRAGSARGCGIDTGGPEDLPHGGCRDPQSDDEEFAVGAAVSPAGVVCGQAQDQGSVERMVRGRPGRLGRDAGAWPRRSRSRCRREIASGRTISRSRSSVCRGSRCSPASNARSAGEPHSSSTELPLQHSDLVPQGADFKVFVSIAPGEQAQHGHSVRQAQVGRSQRHGRQPCRVARQQQERPASTSPVSGSDQRG